MSNTAINILSLGVATLLLLLFFIAPRVWGKSKAIRIGKDPGFFGFSVAAAKREFANYGHQLVERGYQEVRRPVITFLSTDVAIYRSQMRILLYKQ